MGALSARGLATGLAILLSAPLSAASPAAAADPTWSPPVRLGRDGPPDTLRVVTDAAGNDTAAWVVWGTRDSDEWSQVVVSRRPAGGSWSAPRPLGRHGNEQELDLAVTPSGQVTALWIDDHLDSFTGQTEEYAVVSATFDGTTWTAPTDLWRGKSGVDALRLSVSDSGRAVATWVRALPTRPWSVAAMTAVRSADDTWLAPHRLDDGTSRFAVPYGAGIDDSGIATVVWTDEEATRVTRGDGTTWTTPRWLAARFQEGLDLVVNGDGTAGAAFTTPFSHQIKARFMDAAGGWGPAEIIDGRKPTFDAPVPDLTRAPGGDWAVVWARGCRDLRIRERLAGTWQTPVVLATPSCAFEPELVYRNDGDAVLVWNQDMPVNHSANQIRSLTRTAGVWSAEPTALSGRRVWLTDLQAAASSDGHLVTVWSRPARDSDVRAAIGTWD
ncbi:MAG: hypothetical protein U0R80_13425 [Nocardioidaceae bacterium]